jgi:hypothetical protein
MRCDLALVALVALCGLALAHAAHAQDSGWEDSGTTRASGPQALAPLPHDFSGATDQLAVGVDVDVLRLTYLPASREDAAVGVLLPAPPDISIDDIARVDPQAFEDLDRFTRPWLWEESCGQVLAEAPSGCSSDDSSADRGSDSGSGCGGGSYGEGDTGASGGGDGDDPDRVTFSLGEYTGLILVDTTPEDALPLLEAEGIVVPEGAAAAMATVLAEGGAIVALRLDADAPTDGWDSPSAIQIRQERTDPNLRLWPALGTLGGEDTRDLIVHALHEEDAWAPQLDEAGPAADCLLEAAGVPADAMAKAWSTASGVGAESGGAALTWMAWLPDGECLDCGPYDALSEMVPKRLLGPTEQPALTRTRVRYHRADAADPVTISRIEAPPLTGIRRLVDHRWELEAEYPRCDLAKVDEPGTCFGAAYWAERAESGGTESEDLPTSNNRCGPRRAPAALLLLLPFAVAGLRRRR